MILSENFKYMIYTDDAGLHWKTVTYFYMWIYVHIQKTNW